LHFVGLYCTIVLGISGRRIYIHLIRTH